MIIPFLHSVSLVDLSVIMSSVAAVYAAFKGIPLLANRAHLLQRIETLQLQAQEYKESASSYKMSSEGWESAYEQLSKKLCDKIEELSAKLHELEARFGEAVLYIRDFHLYSKTGLGAEPAIPFGLRTYVEEALHEQQEHRLELQHGREELALQKENIQPKVVKRIQVKATARRKRNLR